MFEFQIAYTGTDGEVHFFTMLANSSEQVTELLTPTGLTILDVLPLSPEVSGELELYASDLEDGWEDDYDYIADDLNFDAWRDTSFR